MTKRGLDTPSWSPNFCGKRKLTPPGYCAPKTKRGNDKREAWVNALKDGTFVFYVRYGHSELELAGCVSAKDES